MGECVTRNSCHSTSEKRGELETERSSPLQNEAIPTVKPNSKTEPCCAESNTAPVWAGEATKQLFQLCSACSNLRTAYSNMWPDQLSHGVNNSNTTTHGSALVAVGIRFLFRIFKR